MEFNVGSEYHIPVLYKEVIEGLNLRPNTTVVDGTIGGGGHTSLILNSNNTIIVVGVDRDLEAISFTKEKLKKYSKRLTIVHSNFKEIVNILKEMT